MLFYNLSKIDLLGIVPYHVIMNALAYQADPTSVEPLKVPTTKEVSNIFLGLIIYLGIKYIWA